MKLSDTQLIKMAADSLDLVLLREQYDRAITRNASYDVRYDTISMARDMLVELYINAGMDALHGRKEIA